MKENPSLEKRIAAALVNPNIGSAELSELIVEVKGAASASEQTVEQEHAKAFDLIASPDAKAARETLEAAEFDCDRLHNVLPRLRMRLNTALNTEARDRWLEDYKRLKTKRDQAADKFSEYPELAARLVEIFRLAQAVDKEISQLNGDAPVGESRRLKSVELEARGLDSFSRDNPSIVATLKLPDWEHSSAKMLWPLPQVPLAVQFAAGMSYSHPGGDWAAEREKQSAARRAEQERVAAYYDEQARLREERENAQERAERARRARSPS